MKFREKQEDWHPSTWRGKKHGIDIIVAPTENGWYFYGGGHNSLWDDDGKYATREDAQTAAEAWCIKRHKELKKK